MLEDENPIAVSKFLRNTNSVETSDFIGCKWRMWFDVARVFALIIQIPWSFLVRLYLIPTPFIYALRRLKNLKLLIVECIWA